MFFECGTFLPFSHEGFRNLAVATYQPFLCDEHKSLGYVANLHRAEQVIQWRLCRVYPRVVTPVRP